MMTLRVTEQSEGYERGGARNAALTKFWWKNGKMVLTHHAFYPKVGGYFEHFIYERTGERSFKMTYETSRDGVSWQMGDWLDFTRER